MRKQKLVEKRLDIVPNMPHALYYVEEAFGANGWLAKLPGFSPREGQFELANRIAASFLNSEHLVAEGPTGTGKSMAYLIPAAYHAAATGQRILIATANITLQEQIARKDLPTLKSILPWDFQYTLVKGKSNYLCLRARDSFIMESKRHLRTYNHPGDSDAIDRVIAWATGPNSGDRSDLKGAVPDRIWNLFSVNAEECLGQACQQFDSCPSVQARKNVLKSHIVVTNYHILLTDVLFGFLPQYEIVVLDEAHRMADIARDFFGFEVHEGMVRYAVRKLDHSSEHRKEIEEAASDFFAAVSSFYKSGDYDVRLREPPEIRSTGRLVQAMRKAASFLLQCSRAAIDTDSKEMSKELENRANRLSKLAGQIEEFSILPQPGKVYFIEEDHKHRVRLMAKKVDVSQELRENLFSTTTAVFTSATLAVNGKFKHLLKEVGLEEDTRVFETPTPFNWKDQAVLVVPKDFTSPSDRNFKDKVGEALVDIVKMAKGRTLALFTSRAGMDAAYKRLIAANLPYRILQQSDGQKNELVEQFKKDTSSVLLGLASFWEGVDIPGESLSCVVMDKLPFPLKDDPVLDALESLGEDAFRTYSIPRAVTAFKQGFGRLIRTSTDKGVVVLLDNRIHTKWKVYGYKFVESLPPEVQRSPDLNDIAKILE